MSDSSCDSRTHTCNMKKKKERANRNRKTPCPPGRPSHAQPSMSDVTRYISDIAA